ncbi:biotin--[acetyl-CoA-carboxylase] ligase [Neolewinella xylanilytica]|uniref:biotin--[acetyl-CoA-carboxylase] ligase n=1 Tax=Neolewinella xylanilytica TaxID=1514080 RepID=UPI001474CD11|nr:biotin--[acetyl-CoA-carboxylase] ligase [Neolewinella xylanilytica]
MLTPKVARRFARLGSTNAALLDSLQRDEQLPAGTVYITDDQTAGKGQGTNRWHSSPAANLTFSLLLRPDRLAVNRIFSLTQLTSLAVLDGLLRYLPDLESHDPRIKWPNDLYAGGRKIGGILIQNGLRGDRVQWSVVGVGINVNERAFPPELRQSATSLRLLLGRDIDKAALLDAIFEAFSRRNRLLESGDVDALNTAYHRWLYRREERVDFLRLDDGRRFNARVRGVDTLGRLELTMEQDRVERFELRTLRWLH